MTKPSPQPTFEAPRRHLSVKVLVVVAAVFALGSMSLFACWSRIKERSSRHKIEMVVGPTTVEHNLDAIEAQLAGPSSGADESSEPLAEEIGASARAEAATRLTRPPTQDEASTSITQTPKDFAEGDERIPHAPATDGFAGTFTVKGLGNFRYTDGDFSSVPADVVALSGQAVTVTGFMLPTKQSQKIEEFLLVADVAECCFGMPPGLEHLIRVRMPEGQSTPFEFNEIAVTGTLVVEEERQDGYVVNLMGIDDVTAVTPTGN